MRTDSYIRIVLTAIAVSLTVIAWRPLLQPSPAVAGVASTDLFIEPGVYSLRAADGSRVQLGKVVVDMRTGKIWGFPTGTSSPYPVSLNGFFEPPVSRPFLLGRFDLDALDR